MAPRIFFRTSLVCANCDTRNEASEIQLSSFLGSDPEWTSASPGETIEAGPEELMEGFVLLRTPTTTQIYAIEIWKCKSCQCYSPALLEFRVRTIRVMEFIGARELPGLTSDVLDRAHYITVRIDEWTPRPGEDADRIEAARIEAAKL